VAKFVSSVPAIFTVASICANPDERGVRKNADIPEFKVAAEDDFVTEENGDQTQVKLLRKDKYKDHFEDIPANMKVLDSLWNKHKERNGIRSKNATEEDKRKRAFALGVVEAHDPSQMTRQKSEHLPRNTTNNFINAGGANSNAQINDIYDRTYNEVKRLKEYGEEKIKPSLLKYDEQKMVMDWVRGTEGDQDITPSQVDIKLTDRDELDIYVDGVAKGILPKLGTNIKVAANVAGKKAVVAKGEPNKKAQPQSKPKTIKQGGFTYTLNEKTGQYE